MNHTFLHVGTKESLKLLPFLNGTRMLLACWTIVMRLGRPSNLSLTLHRLTYCNIIGFAASLFRTKANLSNSYFMPACNPISIEYFVFFVL